MNQNRRFQILRYLGLEFCIILPLLGIAFWLGSGLMTDRILNQPDYNRIYIKSDSKRPKKTGIKIVDIRVFINQDREISNVKVSTTQSALKEIRFEFPVIDPNQIEQKISQELNLPLESVKKLIRYHTEEETNSAR